MKKTVAIIAPHADDETLGCGGTIPHLKNIGYDIHWILITDMVASEEYSYNQIKKREEHIEAINSFFGFMSIERFKFKPAHLDSVSVSIIIAKFKCVFDRIKPEIIFVPYRGDAHSDHKISFDAAVAAAKNFRSRYIKKIYCYETLSETEFNIKPNHNNFSPNVFIDITNTISTKIEAMKIYSDQLGEYPFPRSIESIHTLSQMRGIQSGYKNAESFMLLKDTNHFFV